jgi:hypothetical protein
MDCGRFVDAPLTSIASDTMVQLVRSNSLGGPQFDSQLRIFRSRMNEFRHLGVLL